MAVKQLTDKEKSFCVHYCGNGYNATQAAISAGYSKKTAGVIGYENLKKPYIRAEIDRLKENFEELMSNFNVTKQRTALEVSKLCYSGIAHLHNTWITLKEFEELTEDQKLCIQEIDTKVERKVFNEEAYEIKYVKIKLYDKLKAVEILNKIMGWNAAEKLEVKDLTPQISVTQDQKSDIDNL